jgi:hypothetical protein
VDTNSIKSEGPTGPSSYIKGRILMNQLIDLSTHMLVLEVDGGLGVVIRVVPKRWFVDNKVKDTQVLYDMETPETERLYQELTNFPTVDKYHKHISY